MRQTLHIFKKDVRYLWVEIAVALLAAALLTFTVSGQPHGGSSNSDLGRGIIAQLIPLLLPAAWWVLIVRAVHAETLTGDREFWPTRPYDWKSLLAAKMLLILLCINLPLLAAQSILVKQAGFAVSSQTAALLWSQVLITLTYLLPVAAIAALTSGIVQFLMIGMVAIVSALLLTLRFMAFTRLMAGSGWGPLEWWRIYYDWVLIAIAAVTIVLWQYATRRVLTARVFGAAMLLVFAAGAPFSWTSAFAMQTRLSRQRVNESALHAGFFTDFKFTARAFVNRDGSVTLHIPLELSGVPAGMTAKAEGLNAEIDGPGNSVWRVDRDDTPNVSSTGQLIALQATMNGPFYQRVKDQPVKLRGTLYLTLYGNRRVAKLPFDDRARPVPGLGLCTASGGHGAPYFLQCKSAFRPTAELFSIDLDTDPRRAGSYGPLRAISYSPFPAQLSFDPVMPYVTYSTYKGSLDAATLVSIEPLAHVRAPISIDGLRLADYEARLK